MPDQVCVAELLSEHQQGVLDQELAEEEVLGEEEDEAQDREELGGETVALQTDEEEEDVRSNSEDYLMISCEFDGHLCFRLNKSSSISCEVIFIE